MLKRHHYTKPRVLLNQFAECWTELQTLRIMRGNTQLWKGCKLRRRERPVVEVTRKAGLKTTDAVRNHECALELMRSWEWCWFLVWMSSVFCLVGCEWKTTLSCKRIKTVSFFLIHAKNWECQWKDVQHCLLESRADVVAAGRWLWSPLQLCRNFSDWQILLLPGACLLHSPATTVMSFEQPTVS